MGWDGTKKSSDGKSTFILSSRDVHGGAVAAAAGFFSRILKKCMNLVEFQCLQVKGSETG
jgi:hypothetical protein